MSETWMVRRGTLADVDGVVELERRVGEAPHWSVGDYRAIFGVAEGSGAEAVRRRMFVVGPRGDLMGFSVGSVLGIHGSSETAVCWGELESVAVAEAVRREGMGQALCMAVLDWCREEGAERLELEVRAGSEGAQALYRKIGFRESGRRRRYYSDPADDAVLMCLRLRGGGS